MSVLELRKAYEALPEGEQILFASLIAADQLRREPDFELRLERNHNSMDEGKKWRHEEVLRLHEELKKQGL